jgi:enterochelin esterase family protein
LPGDRDVSVNEPAHPVDAAGPDEAHPALIMFDSDIWLSGGKLPNTLDNLINEGEIPPLYALLIDTSDIAARWQELSEGSGMENFVIEQLLPWARERYRITKDPARLIIAGQSLGGLTALRIAMQNPQHIGNVLSQSASLWRGNFMEQMERMEQMEPMEQMAQMKPMEQTADETNELVRDFRGRGRVYAEVGKQEWVLLPPHRTLAKIFKKTGIDCRYEEYNGGHDYACWRGGIAEGLRHLTSNW